MMHNRTFKLLLPVLGLFAGGCVHDQWDYRVVQNVNISQPNQLGSDGPVELKIQPPGPKLPDDVQAWQQEHLVNMSSRQTVLVASWQHDVGPYRTSVGRTLVLMMDGPPKPGQYWITPDNAVLVSYSGYSAPSKERVGLEGSFKIVDVKGKMVTAELSVRDTNDVDSSEFIDEPWDHLHWKPPFAISGRRTFAVTTPSDPVFEKTGVKWIVQ